MKYFKNLGFFSLSCLFLACNDTKEKPISVDTKEQLTINKNITFSDFKKIKGVDNISDVPFDLSTKLDSVRFFVKPDHKSLNLKVVNDKFNSYYGFQEVGDFYKIHFSINNVLDQSIEAYVLKSEFLKRSELSLEGLNISEIRYSSYKGKSDDVNKSFSKFGSIEEVSFQDFNLAKRKSKAQLFSINKSINLKANYYTSTTNPSIKLQKTEATEEGYITYDYIGQSQILNSEIFEEKTDFSSDIYYVFYNLKTGSKDLYTNGFPYVLNDGFAVYSFANSSDVGSNFSVNLLKENPSDQLFFNFTNFRIPNNQEVVLIDKNTIFAEVVNTNSKEIDGKEKKAYIKIIFNPDIL